MSERRDEPIGPTALEADIPADGEQTVPPAAEEQPEKLPGSAWLTLILFAAFVVGTSGCMVNLFFNH